MIKRRDKMKKYEQAQAQIIQFQVSDVISNSWGIQNLGTLGGFGADGVNAVGIDEIS